MEIKPVTTPRSEKPLFISLYDKGYMRVNKALTDLLGLKKGDRVGFYINSNKEYLFGKHNDGYIIRSQSNVEAMFFNAKAMCDTFRNHYGLKPTGAVKLSLCAEPKVYINGKHYVLITNDRTGEAQTPDQPVRSGKVIGETDQR